MGKHQLKFDLSEPVLATRYPRHGRATNTQGVLLLWLPCIELFYNVIALRQQKGATIALDEGRVAHNSRVVHELVTRLAVILRETHLLIRESERIPPFPENREEQVLLERAHDNIPIFVDLAFVYLRRLADRLVVAANPALFGDHRQVPGTFAGYPKFLRSDAPENSQPLCDLTTLRRTYDDESAWFRTLRSKDELGSRKGVRDAIEHHQVIIEPNYYYDEYGSRRIEVRLRSKAADVDEQRELLSTLKGVVAGLCNFSTALTSTIDWGTEYKPWIASPWGHVLPITGDDRDVTGFWPDI